MTCFDTTILTSARTRELPDSYPFIVQRACIKQFTEKWVGPAMTLFDQVHAVLQNDLKKLVERHFGQVGNGNAKGAIL